MNIKQIIDNMASMKSCLETVSKSEHERIDQINNDADLYTLKACIMTRVDCYDYFISWLDDLISTYYEGEKQYEDTLKVLNHIIRKGGDD